VSHWSCTPDGVAHPVSQTLCQGVSAQTQVVLEEPKYRHVSCWTHKRHEKGMESFCVWQLIKQTRKDRNLFVRSGRWLQDIQTYSYVYIADSIIGHKYRQDTQSMASAEDRRQCRESGEDVTGNSALVMISEARAEEVGQANLWLLSLRCSRQTQHHFWFGKSRPHCWPRTQSKDLRSRTVLPSPWNMWARSWALCRPWTISQWTEHSLWMCPWSAHYRSARPPETQAAQ